MFNKRLTENLVLGLSLEEILTFDNGDFVADLSANHHQARVYGQPALVPDDYFGSCIDFDGSVEQYIQIDGFNAFPATQLTVACWVKSDKTKKNSALISFDQVFLLLGSTNLKPTINGQSQDTKIALNDGQWHHIAATWDHKDGKVTLYKDGVVAFTTKVLATKAIKSEGRLVLCQAQDAAGGGFVDKRAFAGQMAHVYLYNKVLNKDDINALMAANKTAQVSFKSEYPLDFTLLDDGEDNIFYISDGQTANIVHFELKNSASLNLLLQPIAQKQASADHFHCRLTFKAKTFEKKLLNDDPAQTFISAKDIPNQWQVSCGQELSDGRVAIYLLYTGTSQLLLEADKSIGFTFEYKSADGDTGARGTNVVLDYQNLSYENNLELLDGSRLKKVDIINHRGKKNIPLFASIVGSNTVLNDGNSATDAKCTASTIIIRLINTLKADTSNPQANQLMFNVANVNSTKNSQFSLIFDDPVGEDWDLASAQHLKAIQASVRHCQSLSAIPLKALVQGDRPSFVFDAPTASLKPGEYFDITLSNIRSNCASGYANIHIHYEDVPGYWDNRFVVQVEKSPIVHKNIDGHKNIGMGVMPDGDHRLKIDGNLAVSGKVKERHQDGGYYDVVPAGSVLMWSNTAGNTIPKGWALCDGKKYKNAIGSTITTPDLRDRFVVGAGKGYQPGNNGGSNTVTLTTDHMPTHAHTLNDPQHNHEQSAKEHSHNIATNTPPFFTQIKSGMFISVSSKSKKGRIELGPMPIRIEMAPSSSHIEQKKAATGISMASSGGGKSHENRPPYFALYYIMKL